MTILDAAIGDLIRMGNIGLRVEDLTPVVPGPDLLPLVFFWQRDPRWATHTYWPGYTIGGSGCLGCCYASALSRVYKSITPVTFFDRAGAAGAVHSGSLSSPARIQVAYPESVWEGAVHWRDKAADMVFLAKELEEHDVAVIELAFDPHSPVKIVYANGTVRWNTHYLVLTGLNRAYDPYTGEFITLTESAYARPGWKVERIITGVRLLHIKPVE